MMRVMPHHYETALRPRLWMCNEDWSARVRALKTDLRRCAMLIGVMVASLAAVGLLAALGPVVGMATAVGILVVVYTERFVLGTLGAWRRTQECWAWVEAEQRAMERARIVGSLRIVSCVQSLRFQGLQVLATLQYRRRDAATRLRRGPIVITLLPRLTTRSLRACA